MAKIRKPRGSKKKDSKPRKKPPKNSGRKPGGQPGNKNAERHGFYSSRFTATENDSLDKQESADLKAEINMLRVYIKRLTGEIDFDPVYIQGKDENKAPIQSNIRDDHYLRQLNTLGLMSTAISTLVRTDYLVKGKAGDVNDSIERALEEIRLEMGL